MKKAFTMIELLIVLVVIGILTVVIMPRLDEDKLNEASEQVLSHIKYTQHLALSDDQYSSDDNVWYKGRWQIFFSNTEDGSDDLWAYSIFSDKAVLV